MPISVCMGADLQEIVFKLIQATQAEGWTDKLIAGAREINPGNPKLFASIIATNEVGAVNFSALR